MWIENENGNFVKSENGTLVTVFYQENEYSGKFGWKFVCDGEFSDFYNTCQDAKNEAERSYF